MISFCFATRGRPEIFKQMCLSALETADNPADIEFVSYHDNDDASVYEYVGNHKEVVGERVGVILGNIASQKIATGPIYMYGADDMIFKTKGWDTRVKEAFDQYPDKIVLVCPDNDNWRTWKFGVTGFIHKNWVDTVGHFLNPHPDAQSGDQWLNELSTKINRRVHLLDVIVEHINVRDRVHREKNRRGREQQYTKRYYLPEMAEMRSKEAKQLQDFIDNFKIESN
jgi:hypothetical protein